MLAVSTVLLGCLLCFHMTRLAAAATRRQTAVLRALGAGRGQVLGVDALTAAVTGGVGIAAGCLLGRWGAVAAIPVVVRLLGLAPGPVPTPLPAYAVGAVAATVVIAVTLCAGRSWAVPPMAFLAERTEGRPLRWLTPVALGALAAGVGGVVLAAGDPAKGMAAAVVLMLGSVATLRVGLGAWGHRGRRRVRPGGAVRALGVRAIARDADLAGTSAGLVMATMAVLLATVIGHQATAGAVDTTLVRQFGADVQIGGDRALPPDAAARLAALPGVRRVALLGYGQAAPLDGEGEPRAVPLVAIDPGTYFAISDFDWKEGTQAAVAQALGAGTGVALARPVADSLGLHQGATIRLQTASGPVTREVAGVFVSFAGSGVVVGEADAAAHFGVTEHNSALITVDGPPGAVAEAVDRALPGNRPRLTAGYRRQARDQLLSLFGIGYGALLTAALLCTVGLGASMSASVLRRERELRLLRGAGATRAQVVRMLGVEAALLVSLGFAGALPLGWLLARVLLDAFRSTMGLDLPARLPAGVLVAAPLGVAVLTGLAIVLPARRAARLALVR
jgi:putative ABC transport system permease protein